MFALKDEKEFAMLEKFQARVKDLGQDDYTLIRFLRAREHNLDKAEDMLRKSVEWRRVNRVSEFLNWKPSSPLFIDHSPIVCTGVDYDGCAVMYAPFGRWDSREKLEMGLQKDCNDYLYFTLERLMVHIRKCKAGKMTIIADLEGLSYRQVTHVESCQLLFTWTQKFEKFYPEVLERAIILNAPWIFSTVFSLLRTVLTGNTLAKINFINSDKDKCLNILRQIMPEESIPRECIKSL